MVTRPTKAERETKKQLRLLIADCQTFIAWLDDEMKYPSSSERGSRVARATSQLEMSVDLRRQFLGDPKVHRR